MVRRVCSILVLQSCKGFTPDIYHMWCCTKNQCNILYTKQAIEDLGYDPMDDLQFLQCFSSEQSGAPHEDGGGSTVLTPETSVAAKNAYWRAAWSAAAACSVAAIAVALN